MFDFYERRKIKQWLYSWSFFVVLLIASVFLTHGVWGVYQKERQTRINKQQRLAHLDELNTRREALEKEINQLSTERGIDEEIRQKFEVAMEGEEVIVIVDPPLNGSLSNITESKNTFERFLGAVMFWR